MPSMGYRIYILLLLTLISAISSVDRQILDILVEPIRKEFDLSDGQMGLLNGLAYAGVFALSAIPLARVADRYPRKTVIALCVAFWSMATVVSSFAKGFTHLFVARMGVGFGEAGLSSPGPAMLSDIFPREQRGTVTSLYMTGPAIGIGIAYAVGGWAVETWGWRSAFLIAGIPGLIIAPIFFMTVRNFPKGMADGVVRDVAQPPLLKTLKAIFRIKTVMWMMAGLCFLGMLSNGVLRWVPAYLSRSFDMEAIEFGAQLGTAVAVGNFAGHLIGGPLADYVGRRDMRWQFGIAVVAVVGAGLSVFALFNTDSVAMFYPLAGLLSFTAGLFAAPLIMICTTLPPVWARATTTAITLMGVYLIGYGVGPAMIGLLSDALVPAFGEASLQTALLSITTLAIPAGICFLLAMRHYRADLAASEAAIAREAAQSQA